MMLEIDLVATSTGCICSVRFGAKKKFFDLNVKGKEACINALC